MGWSDSPKVENWHDDIQTIEQELEHRNQIPDLIYTSALGRARHTGEHLAEHFERSVQHCQSLNEVNYGDLAEKSKKWVAAHYPLHKKDPDFVYPGGESFAGMQKRAVGFVSELAMKHPGQTLLCVAHAGVIRALVSHFLDLEFSLQLKRQIPHRYIGALTFDGLHCNHYAEWGELSGFVSDQEISLPWTVSKPQSTPDSHHA